MAAVAARVATKHGRRDLTSESNDHSIGNHPEIRSSREGTTSGPYPTMKTPRNQNQSQKQKHKRSQNQNQQP